MKDFNNIISKNMKRIRDERKLSLDNLAKMTGVSKSMLSQIEKGDVSPTVSTVWKISNGLKISFTELMSRPEADIELVDKSEIKPLVEDNGRFRNFPVFPFDSTRRFEVYSIEIDRRGGLNAEAHPKGTQEFITVYSGEVAISVNGEEFVVTAGNSIRFKADSPHAYKNTGDGVCILSMVIHYPL